MSSSLVLIGLVTIGGYSFFVAFISRHEIVRGQIEEVGGSPGSVLEAAHCALAELGVGGAKLLVSLSRMLSVIQCDMAATRM